MPSASVQSRGADALAVARSRRVNTITVRKKAQLASTLSSFHNQPSFPPSKCAMEDSQETRLPSSLPPSLPSSKRAVEDSQETRLSDDQSELSSVGGTPREQWDYHSSTHNQRYEPPSQIQLQQRCHSDDQQQQQSDEQQHLQRRRHSDDQQQYLQQRHHSDDQQQQRRHIDEQQQWDVYEHLSHLRDGPPQQRRQSFQQHEGYSQQRQLLANSTNNNNNNNTPSNHPNQQEQDLSQQRRPLANLTNNTATSTQLTDLSPQQSIIPEWDGCTQDAIIKRLKALDKEQLQSFSIREFYKSYSSWEKMSMDQRNKTVSYFRSLPEEMQGVSVFVLYFNFHYNC